MTSAMAHAVVLLAAAVDASRVPRTEVVLTDSGWSAAGPTMIFASDTMAEPEGETGGPAEAASVGTLGELSKCGGRAPKAMGSRIARANNRRFGITGPRDNPDPHLARVAGAQPGSDAATVGVAPRGLPNAPTMRWGRDEALGNDEETTRGGMWGDVMADAAGSEGLAPAGRCDECGGSQGLSRAETTSIGGLVRAALLHSAMLGRGGGLARGFSGTVGARTQR